MKPKDSSNELPKWIDPVVKLLSYTALSGKVSKKQRLDKVGIIRTIELSTSMSDEELSYFLDVFVGEGQKVNKKAAFVANRLTEEARELEDAKMLPKGFVTNTIFDVSVGEE